MPTPSQQVPADNLSGNQPRRKRAPREFYIAIRSDGKTKGEDPKSENNVYDNTGPQGEKPKSENKIKKFTKRVKTGFTSLEDNLSLFANQKLSHWALVVEAYPNEPKSRRFFEICTKYKESSASDSDRSDRYEDDEAEGLPKASTSTLGMRVGLGPKPGRAAGQGQSFRPEPKFLQPDYQQIGGLCWKLLSSLKSQTRFTNSEIRKEAERIWKRQQDYRFFDNNCHRFCILLAIHIRAKQSTFLRLLNAKILKKQAGMSERALGEVSKFLMPKKNLVN